jgi:hypothetical protein
MLARYTQKAEGITEEIDTLKRLKEFVKKRN